MDYWLVRPCLCALVSSLGITVSAAAEKVDIYCLAFSHTNEADAAIAKTIEKVDKTFGNYFFKLILSTLMNFRESLKSALNASSCLLPAIFIKSSLKAPGGLRR